MLDFWMTCGPRSLSLWVVFSRVLELPVITGYHAVEVKLGASLCIQLGWRNVVTSQGVPCLQVEVEKDSRHKGHPEGTYCTIHVLYVGFQELPGWNTSVAVTIKVGRSTSSVLGSVCFVSSGQLIWFFLLYQVTQDSTLQMTQVHNNYHQVNPFMLD